MGEGHFGTTQIPAEAEPRDAMGDTVSIFSTRIPAPPILALGIDSALQVGDEEARLKIYCYHERLAVMVLGSLCSSNQKLMSRKHTMFPVALLLLSASGLTAMGCGAQQGSNLLLLRPLEARSELRRGDETVCPYVMPSIT